MGVVNLKIVFFFFFGLHICLCPTSMPRVFGGQKRRLDPLGVALEIVVLGIELDPLEEQPCS